MSWFDRVRSSLKQDTLAADLDEELELHVDLKTRELMSTGFSREEARRQALRQFGNVGLVKERTRDFDTLQWMGDLVRDTRVSVRALRKTPGFTSVVLLTLALGIAANTAVFGLVNGLLFNLLPYPDSGQLMALMSRDAKGRENWTNYEDLLDWRMQSAQFSHLGGWISQSANLTGDFEPDRVRAGFVTANFLSMLGVAPAAGRDFREGEDQAGAERVVITSYGLWQGKFGGDPAFVGRQLTLNGEAFTAVGVMPQDFQFPVDTIDVWMPLPYYPNYKRDRAEIDIASVGRLRTGATMKEAQAEMTGIAAALSQQYPQSNQDRGVAVHTFQEMATADVRPMLLMFWAAVGCVFLIACFNIANLSLSRVMSRERELGLRSALGASKSQIFRHLLAENLVLCLVGGAAGMLIGTAGARWLVHSQAGFLPAGFTVNLSPTIIAFSLGSAFLAALLFSGLPALHLLRGDLFDALRDGVRSAGASHSRAWLRKGLVVVELALSLTLLAGAGLLLKSFQRASGVDPGFKPENVLTLEYRMPRSKYPKPEDQVNFHYQVGERVRALPGVRTASVARAVPLSGNGAQMTFQIVGAPQPPKGSEPHALLNAVDPWYFQTLGIPVLRGRVFTPEDRLASQRVAVINQSLAQRMFPGEDPVGRTIVSTGELETRATIVGVAGDTVHFGLEEKQTMQVYVPLPQLPFIFGSLMVKTELPPMSMASAVRAAVWQVDKDQPVWKVRSLETLVDNRIAYRRFMAWFVGAFSAFALLLASLGIYGVLSHWVSLRTREIGVRVALGARPQEVARLILRQGAVIVLLGVAVGVVAAVAAGQAIRTLLFGVTGADPFTLAAVAVLLLLVGLAACYLPARRALTVDPAQVLRLD